MPKTLRVKYFSVTAPALNPVLFRALSSLSVRTPATKEQRLLVIPSDSDLLAPVSMRIFLVEAMMAQRKNLPGETDPKRAADRNEDPLTGEAGSHPVGTGLGAAVGGAAAGALAGSLVGQWVPPWAQ